jgi:MFS family permease
MAAGVCAALHVGKLAPAIAVLQRDLGLTLVEAGFLLGMVQGAGMTLGLLVGAWCDGLGARRSLMLGLLLQAAASASGAGVSGAGPMLVLRAVEGLGFLMVVLPAPGLLRALTPPERLRGMLGTWGAFMPVAIALALLAGPLVIESGGWRTWWAGLAAVSAAMALTLRFTVPAQAAPSSVTQAPSAAAPGWADSALRTLARRVAITLRAPGPWFVALTFAVYSSQWLAVVGFLPTIVAQAGMGPLLSGFVAAGVAAANILGNAASGHLMQRGVPAPVLLAAGFSTMAAGAVLGFAPLLDPGSAGRLVALALFSAVGGLIPGTLFALAVQVAPDERVVSSTVGWMQQWSAAGQVLGPPAVAWVASAAGGWERTWLATGACSLAGLALAAGLAHWQASRRAPR